MDGDYKEYLSLKFACIYLVIRTLPLVLEASSYPRDRKILFSCRLRRAARRNDSICPFRTTDFLKGHADAQTSSPTGPAQVGCQQTPYRSLDTPPRGSSARSRNSAES
jgi:hypothetical protein